MTEHRPDPIRLAELLRGLGDCWKELDGELMRKGGPSSSSGASEARTPLDLSVLDAKRAIENFATTYAHMLIDDDPEWQPPATVPGLLNAMSMRIGHWTHSDDALVAYEFADDLDRLARECWGVARPTGIARIPIGTCYADECDGRMRVTIDRDRPMDERSLALWQPTAVCDQDGAHVMLARLYAEQVRHPVPSAAVQS